MYRQAQTALFSKLNLAVKQSLWFLFTKVTLTKLRLLTCSFVSPCSDTPNPGSSVRVWTQMKMGSRMAPIKTQGSSTGESSLAALLVRHPTIALDW